MLYFVKLIEKQVPYPLNGVGSHMYSNISFIWVDISSENLKKKICGFHIIIIFQYNVGS